MKIQDIKIFETYIRCINEGTWSFPGTVIKAKELEQLMKKEISKENASDVLYSIIGDDDLYDQFDELDSGDDVRGYIKSKLKSWIEDLEGPKKIKWNNNWDPQAVSILKKLI